MTTDRPLPPAEFDVQAHRGDVAADDRVGIRRWGVMLTIGDARRLAHELVGSAETLDPSEKATRLPSPRAALLDIADRLEPLVPEGSISGRAIPKFIRSTANEYPEADPAEAPRAVDWPSSVEVRYDDVVVAEIRTWLQRIDERTALHSRAMLDVYEASVTAQREAAERPPQPRAIGPIEIRSAALDAAARNWQRSGAHTDADVLRTAVTFAAFIQRGDQ